MSYLIIDLKVACPVFSLASLFRSYSFVYTQLSFIDSRIRHEEHDILHSLFVLSFFQPLYFILLWYDSYSYHSFWIM